MNWGLDKDMTLKSARSSIKLDIRERLGGFIYNYLDTPTGTYYRRLKRRPPMKEAVKVTVSFEESQIMYFDNQSEVRLR